MSNVISESEHPQIRHLETQLAVARREINNLRQQLKSLSFTHKKECQNIKQKLENWRCLGCKNNYELDTEEGAVADCSESIELHEIGKIYTDFPEKRGTPRQPLVSGNSMARLALGSNIFTNPSHALEGLQDFSHMWILFYFHKNHSTHVKAKVSPPRLNGAKTGVFATRSPHRPNPVGLSLVKIDRIMENNIYFSGVDMIDRTPVLDIKPYIPHYDNPCTIYSSEPHHEVESPSSPLIPSASPLGDIRLMDGHDNIGTNQVNGTIFLEESDIRRTSGQLYSRIGEREAPDGEEEEASVSTQTNHHLHIPTSEGRIRMPSWINDSPVSTLSVTFKQRALHQLRQLNSEGEEKKNVIANILREDPRSTYLRQRWGSHCYVFRISDLYVSCKFNDVSHTVTVYQVFQDDVAN